MKQCKVEFDFSRLIGRIVERFGSRRAFCTVAGISEAILSSRVNNQSPFKDYEIFSFCKPELLDIKDDEVVAYFFTEKVR